MKQAMKHHDTAMDLAADALAAQRCGDAAEKQRLFLAALVEVERAAEAVFSLKELEPTRSIVLRSAAMLALDCTDFDKAERFASMALAGSPPGRLRDEFHDIFSRASFRRHLKLKGALLADDQVRLAMEGTVVAPGIVERGAFDRRVEAFSKLLFRTAARKKNLPYRTEGRWPAKEHEAFDLFYQVAEAASFAVVLRVGHPLAEVDMFSSPSLVVQEIADCLDLFEKEEDEKLRARIADENYYMNFVGLAKELQPDGLEVRLVGLTIVTEGQVREVPLQRKRPKIVKMNPPDVALGIAAESKKRKPRLAVVSGFLEAADSRRERGKGFIVLTGPEDGEQKIRVPEGMADIVRMHYDKYVTVGLEPKGRGLVLRDITEDNEP